MVIRGNRIMAAACILTLSEGKSISGSWARVTARRWALRKRRRGHFIVSEETGIISMAKEGRLTRHLDRVALERVLLTMYHQKESSLWSVLLEKTKRRKGGAA